MFRRLSPQETLARLAKAFADVETMTRQELIDFCVWNDPNGDAEDCTTDELREVVRAWARDDENCETVHLSSTQICVDFSSTTTH